MAGGSGPAPIFLVLTALAVVLAIVFLLFADVLLIGLFGRSSLDAATGGSASTSASTPASTSASNVSAISDLLLQEEKRQQQLRQQQEDKEKLPLLTLLVLSANVPAAHAPLIVPPANDAAAVGGAGDGAAAAAAAPQELSEASSAAAGGGAGTAEAEAGGLVSKGDSSGSSSSSSSGSSSGSSSSSSSGSHAGLIPVVLFLRGNPGCNRGRYMQASLRQALLLNTWLILIGPRACSQEMGEMGVELEVYEDYEGNSGIEERFVTEIGKVMAYHVRWFFLYEMMVRRNISRVFYTDNDVLLFVNVTQFVQSHLPEAKLSLAMRSNSVRIRAVSGHVSLWSQEALADFLAFFILFFQASASSAGSVARCQHQASASSAGTVSRCQHGAAGVAIQTTWSVFLLTPSFL
ncbi:hypothetical protein CLOP_g22108 [Closterium sp. NIES-67]|nr:hypothetical protein CLOP_g22108 [Closterium sp. NIES-67]